LSGTSGLPDPRARFTDRVADYVRYRPDYPTGVLEALRQAGLGPGTAVADVGSGTGIFSNLLLESGAEVYAVEPNEAMRRAAEELLGGEPRFHSIAGSAEETGLSAGAVELVTAAQAFHWFDPPTARAEFRRILRPGGMVALVWNSRRERSTPFLAEYEELLKRYGTDYGRVNHRQVDGDRVREFFGGTVERLTFPHAQALDRGGLRGRLLSSSYTPREGDPARAPMLAALDAIFNRHAAGGAVSIEYETELYLGRMG
jgi:SAM-dependent methyltransferase